LFQGPAVAISCTTGIYALQFSGLSRREGERDEIGVARIKCCGIRRQKEYGDDGKRPLATFHGPAPFRSKNTASLQSVSTAGHYGLKSDIALVAPVIENDGNF
jgi:hypothetical protein